VKGYLERLFPVVMNRLPGCEIVEHNIQRDHVHVVMIIPPKYAGADVLQRIKGFSSMKMRRRFEWLKKVYWKEKGVVWSPGYFISTVRVDEKTVIEYVKWQEKQDSWQAQSEFKDIFYLISEDLSSKTALNYIQDILIKRLKMAKKIFGEVFLTF